MEPVEKILFDKLEQRKKNGNFRILKPFSSQIDFCSNDYLGLASNPELITLINDNYKKHKITNGSTGSRLLAGNSEAAVKLEEYLAQIFEADKALFFNSGYSANLAILSSVPQKGDTILYDELIHASLREGGRLSFAQQFSFRHNDLNDLENKLKKAVGHKFIVAESVYSMDGDFGDIDGILNLCKKYSSYLILDEAHSTGIWGKNGNGIACFKNLHSGIFARIYTFGKAMGVHGACIAGQEVLIDYLINFARPFIYTTAPPLHNLVSVKSAFEYLTKNIYLQKEISDKLTFFKIYLSDYFRDIQYQLIPSESPIQIIKIGGNEKTKFVSNELQNEGFDIRPVLSPTVKENSERLRICLHTFNSKQDIERMITALKEKIELAEKKFL